MPWRSLAVMQGMPQNAAAVQADNEALLTIGARPVPVDVRLDDGTQIDARVVSSSVDAHLTFEKFLTPEELPEVSWDFVYGTNMQHAFLREVDENLRRDQAREGEGEGQAEL